ncbi:DUF2061 domain-containing protein [Joostella atrarenae]|uniref:DUF2061 domain-containing protein n=1 Tax=Joostella atrarenae TaxID=679257 RepID=A0ABS9J687_9FLAO|nr:DUF2061 domain-containing protein [Joostella atrarenae]MCF8715924.1 DUF2061 domain-containing protein [Joostella atrarenae]
MILDKVFQGNRSKEGSERTLSGDKVSRSIAKSVSWRIVGTLDTVLISWFVTGTLTLALSIGLIELVTKMTLYFFHERIWERIKWGK